jgi:excisionase family DNA binding protein
MSVFNPTLTPQEFAKLYSVSLRVVMRMLHDGRLTAVDVAAGRGRNKRWRIRPQDVAEFEHRRLNAPPPAAARKRRRAGQKPAGYTKFFEES